MRRRPCLIALLLVAAPVAARAEAGGSVAVLYAGSLVNVMEHGIGPAFTKATGVAFQGFAAGSNGLANQIKGRLRRGDVFISANPKVNDDLMGAGNGEWVRWYVNFAESPLVIGYNPDGKAAAALKSKPWYEALEEPGLRIGRTDPKLDPKGALTVRLMDKAEAVYKTPGLAQKVLGSPDNPDQVRPEENLVGRLQAGQLDVGFFYSTETADLKIPSVPLPPEVSLSAHYTVTLLRDGADPEGAMAFVTFLLGPEGRSIMREHGLDLKPATVGGEAAAVPAEIAGAVDHSR